MDNNVYDLIIIGAGPAGLTAGIYASRYKLKNLILGKIFGGMISEAHKVCNFPTHPEITGMELTTKLIQHAQSLGSEIKIEEVIEIRKEELFKIKTNQNEYTSKKIILATGTEKRKLNIPGEKEFLGKGVSYCATCDAGFYKDKIVGVVGGSDAALTAALLLSEYAKKVYIIYRRDKFFRAEPSWIEQVEKNNKIESKFNSEIKEIYGQQNVEGVKLKDGTELKLDGIFIEIGSNPSELFSDQLKIKKSEGYIIVNKKQETNIKGVFAAGDITNNPLKQAITAAAEGAIAANSAYEEITKEK